MPEVVQQRRRESVAGRLVVDALLGWKLLLHFGEARQQAHHHVRSAERVREARVFGTGEHQRSEAELAHSAQPLHLARVEQRRDDRLCESLERNEPVHRIAEDHRGGP